MRAPRLDHTEAPPVGVRLGFPAGEGTRTDPQASARRQAGHAGRFRVPAKTLPSYACLDK